MEKTGYIPILKIGKFLITSPQKALHDRMAVQFQQDIQEKLVETGAKGLILDISAIDVVDSFMGRVIREIAVSSNLMGAEVVVIGMKPAVAVVMTEMGFELERVHTALNLEKGLALLRKKTRRRDKC